MLGAFRFSGGKIIAAMFLTSYFDPARMDHLRFDDIAQKSDLGDRRFKTHRVLSASANRRIRSGRRQATMRSDSGNAMFLAS